MATRTAILTYSMIDGACAAAMVLLHKPESDVFVSSAAAIGYRLQMLAEKHKAYAEINICGLGVHCPWEEVERGAAALKKKGAKLIWYCGRGYLNREEERYNKIADTVFLPRGSNTACVQHSLGLTEHAVGKLLVKIATFDPNIADEAKNVQPDDEVAYWLDLIKGSILEYWKFQDQESYVNTIKRLTSLAKDEASARIVRNYRSYGTRYILHGRTRLVCQLRETIRKAAAADDNVLICGPTGVGKEHVAHLIFERCNRATERFIPVNCADFAGNAGLANSTLFGHVKGAFTGAVADRKGMFQMADGGVLFLDEVGELPMEVQGKLLRVLEDGQIRPEGSDEAKCVNVRLIAATNRNLPAMIRKGCFRADLYYRLAEIPIQVPPLAQRREDIACIVKARLAAWQEEGRMLRLSATDMRLLQNYDWPGNVRQLLAVLKRVATLGISVDAAIAEERALGVLAAEGENQKDGFMPTAADDIMTIERLKRAYAKQCWEIMGKNSQKTAKLLGITRNTLRDWLEKND